MKQDKKKYLLLISSLFLLFLAIRYWDGLILLLGVAINAAVPLLLGAVFAYILNILMSFFDRHYIKNEKVKFLQKLRRPYSIVMAFISLIAIIALVVTLVLPELIRCITSLVKQAPATIELIMTFLYENTDLQKYLNMAGESLPTDYSELVDKAIETAGTLLVGVGGAMTSVFSAVSSVFSKLVTAVVAIIFSIYLLAEKEHLLDQGKRLVKIYQPKRYDALHHILKVMNESFHNFIVGQCTEAVILGGLCTIGMLILQLPYAVMIGALIGFTALIPVAGAYIGAGVGAFMILTVSPVKALIFLIFLVVLQQLEGNIIYPKVVGDSIGLPGLWVLAAITIGGGLMGVLGMLVAVPLVATLYKLIGEDMKKREGLTVEEQPKEQPEEEQNIEEENE